MKNPIMQFFKWEHLRPDLQMISKEIAQLAEKMDEVLPDNAEKSAGLRKLLEAKDCFVRSQIQIDEAE